MKKLLFVMNPFAGKRKANKVLADILTRFCAAGFEVSVYMTQGQGDAMAEVERRAAQMNLVVCCGGDGTFNETVAGLMHSGMQVPIGYIPAGSTNDFASSLGIPTNIMKAVTGIIEGQPSRYDICRFGQRYFTYVASFGAFTKSSYATPQSAKNALGHMAYVINGLQEVPQIHSEHLRLTFDDETIEGNYVFGAISNSTSLGGVLTMDPKRVSMQDGLFEVLLIRAPKNIIELGECLQSMQNRTFASSMITMRSANRVVIQANPEMPWTLDGERQEGVEEIVVENVHDAIQLIK